MQLKLLPLFPNRHKLAAEIAPRRERQPGTCKRCKLSFNSGNPCLPVDGRVGGLLIVSDYPGEQEDRAGIPMCGASGQFLRNNIKAMWGSSQPVAYTNALNCRVPQGATLTQLADPIKKCRDYLRDTLEEVQPTRVIAMGAVAIHSLTGRVLPPMSVRRGYTFLSNGVPVFYMTNPAHACRNFFLKSRFETDLKWALFTQPKKRNGVYIVIRSLEEAAYAEERLMAEPKWHTFDCETKGRMFDQGFGVTTVSICKGGDDYVFVWDEVALANPKLCAPMKRVLESPVGKGGFNVKYDINAVFADPDLRIDVPNVTADLMLWRHQSDSNIKDNSLNVCTEVLGLGGAKEEGHSAVKNMVTAMKKSAKKSVLFKDQLQFGQTRDELQDAFEATYPDVRAQAYAYAKIDQDTRNRYNCRDTFSTDQGILAYQDVMERSAHMKWMWEEIYRPAIRGMAFIERSGMAVDRNAVVALAMALDHSINDLKFQLNHYGKCDWDSPYKLGKFLFGPVSMGGLGLPEMVNKKGKSGSTEAAVLAQLRGKHPIIEVLEEYRKLSTLQKRYARGMLPYICEDGRVHSSMLLEGTDTGRISSRDPNMQNVPTKEGDKWALMVRNCFIARPGYTLCVWDYSQLELRIAALLSQDQKFIEVVNSGADIHRATAAMVYGKTLAEVTDDERTYVKRIVFGCVSMDTQVLTRRGWLRVEDLCVGQYVLGRTGWVRIKEVVLYPDAPVVDWNGFRVTPNHRWWSMRPNGSTIMTARFTTLDTLAAQDHIVLAEDYSWMNPPSSLVPSLDQPTRRFLSQGSRSVTKATSTPPVPSGREPVWCIRTEDETFVMRRGDAIALTGNTLYGMRAFKLYKDLNLKSVEYAQSLIDKIFGTYERLAAWLEENIAYARKNGCVWTWWKNKPAYRRYVFDILSKDKDAREHAERVVKNTPVQGSAALYMNRGVDDVGQWIRQTNFPALPVNTVHDALYLEVRDDHVAEALEVVPQILKQHEDPRVPLVVDAKIGPRWGMLEKAKKKS